MSRYLVDKFLYRVDRSPEALEAYIKDPAALVLEWEETEGPCLFDGERTSAHRFTEEERRALIDRDFERLYAMGAHPFLLWSFMRPVLQREMSDSRLLVEKYVSAIRQYGRPDFAT